MSNKVIENPEDIFAMSDEEFLEATQSPQQMDQVDEPKKEETEAKEDLVDEESEVLDDPTEQTPEEAQTTSEVFGSGSEKTEPKQEEQETVEISEEELRSLYQKVMTPFKANGRMVELKSPDEVLQLMQMGANYTKKMQAMQPYKKALMMLEKHQLLDEDKLSLLIDIHNKDPEALKKFLKESEIDPLDIDMHSESSYQTGRNRVSDQEVNLTNAIEEVQSLDGGVETLNEINSKWDKVSKQALWDSPQLLGIIHSQLHSGTYATVVNEVERRKLVGLIDPNTPFIQAYKVVGDEMVNSGQVSTAAPARVNSKSTSTTKPMGQDKRIKSMGSARSTPSKSNDSLNPLSMSDEEFLKRFENRV